MCTTTPTVTMPMPAKLVNALSEYDDLVTRLPKLAALDDAAEQLGQGLPVRQDLWFRLLSTVSEADICTALIGLGVTALEASRHRPARRRGRRR